MAGEEPPYLTVGTDVSAKYKGAFCEAKIKKVTRSVKCKLTFKNNVGVAIVTDDQVRGTLRVGAHVEAKHPEKNAYLEAVINKLNDYSQYTVVFDDGDETTLRRTSLCLKSGRHFAESETLDQLPLTHPEHFGNPVMNSKGRRSRTTARSPAVDESSDDEQSSKKKETKAKPTDPDIGRVVSVELTDKKKNKENWFPALIISPKCQDSLRVKKQEEYLVRSFRDGKYYVVNKKDSKDFSRELVNKVDNNPLKTAVEKVLTYLDKDDLPNHWDRDVLFGLEDSSNEDSDQGTDSDTSDDEPSEEKDRFVAQLYKFMDDRGTPINKAPSVCSRDLNLYKLFKVVQKAGGYNRVTNQMQWKTVYAKMGFPPGSSSVFHQIKLAYKKYLHGFEEFYRKLGISMGSSTRSGRVRYRSGRYLLMARDQHFKGTRKRSSKTEAKSASCEKSAEKAKVQDEEEIKDDDSEENKSDKVEKDSSIDNNESQKIETNVQEDKKNETTKIKVEKDDESNDDSKGERDESDAESPKMMKEERKHKTKFKASNLRMQEDETSLPKRRGRKKIEKTTNDDDDSSNNNDDDEEDCRDSLNISVGDRVKVKYGRGRQQKIYEAKVLKLGEEDSDKEYFVHYTGWNMRYDEWVKRHRIVKNLSQKTSGRRPRSTTPAKNVKAPAKKGRPQGSASNKKEITTDRKSLTPTSSLRGRSCRGEKSSDSFTTDQKRLTRHSSLQRDASDESDSDSTENQQKRTNRSSMKKGTQVGDADSPRVIKTEDDETQEVMTRKEADEKDDKGKMSSSKTEKDNVRKDSPVEKSSKEKVDVKVSDEEDGKKQIKKIKEKQKCDDNIEQLEDSLKTIRRPRGRPPRQVGEEKKTVPATVAEKKPTSRTASDVKSELDVTGSESQTQVMAMSDSTKVSGTGQDTSLVEVSVKDVDKKEKSEDVEELEDVNDDVESLVKEEMIVSDAENEAEKIEEPSTTLEEDMVAETNDEQLESEAAEHTVIDQAPMDEDTISLVEEPKLDLLCNENITEDEESSGEEPRVAADIPQTFTDVDESHSKLEISEGGEKAADIVNADRNATSSEVLLEEVPIIVVETPVLEVERNVLNTESQSVADSDKFDLIKCETTRECERLLKKEIPIVSEPTQLIALEKSDIETCEETKSSEMDIYEYSEDSFEEKINFNENNLKKLDKPSVVEAHKTDLPPEMPESAVDVPTVGNKLKVEIENETEEMVIPQRYSYLPTDLASINEPQVEIKPERNDLKMEPTVSSFSGSSFVAHSSKSVKKEKKRKTHKTEKRKLLAEADSSEDGSGNDEPKSKKRKNRDDEFSSKKESKSKEQKQKKSRDKKNKSKGERDELKQLKKKGSAEKSRKKECKKKKESPDKCRKERDEDLKLIVDSDDISSVSSDSCQRKEKRKSKKHQHRCEKSREDSEKKRVKKYKLMHDDGATSDESNRGKKTRREEKSKSKKKRDKGKLKELPVSSEDSNSSKVSGTALGKSKERSGDKLDKINKTNDGECDMSNYLMCEEKVPASPVGMSDVPEVSSGLEDRPDLSESVKGKENMRNRSNIGGNDTASSSYASVSPHRHLKLEVTDSLTIIDNTPPTTPESSGTAVSESLNQDHDSPSCMSPNDTDSNQLATTGKSSQSSSPNDYSDDTDRCHELLIDETDNRVEIAAGSDEGEREDAKVSGGYGATSSIKRSTLDHAVQARKKKKRHRKHSSSISESNKHSSALDSATSGRGSKHFKGAELDDLPSSTSEPSFTTSGLLLSRLNPAGGISDPSMLPHPTRPSRFNFHVELDDYADGDQRIAIIQEKLTELRRAYMALKAEVACIDRRRKKLKKKEKEAASSSTAVATTFVECN